VEVTIELIVPQLTAAKTLDWSRCEQFHNRIRWMEHDPPVVGDRIYKFEHYFLVCRRYLYDGGATMTLACLLDFKLPPVRYHEILIDCIKTVGMYNFSDGETSHIFSHVSKECLQLHGFSGPAVYLS
jgi:hypothetical protein